MKRFFAQEIAKQPLAPPKSASTCPASISEAAIFNSLSAMQFFSANLPNHAVLNNLTLKTYCTIKPLSSALLIANAATAAAAH